MTSPQFNALKPIQKLLKSLGRLDLPVETSRLSSEAAKGLEQLQKHLAEGEEQGRLAALYRVSSILGGSLNLNEVLNQVMDAVIELTRAERGFLVLVAPESGELVCVQRVILLGRVCPRKTWRLAAQ
ncbi:MAG: hypothetical protein HC806_06995 [Anaerolineae bacterium]|nr:hypothetical protein [Anaerolineae bacterium]